MTRRPNPINVSPAFSPNLDFFRPFPKFPSELNEWNRMTDPVENLNILWSTLVVHEFVRNGVDYFCISPGSRSTPLTVAVARHPDAHQRIFYDERGAAFHALGYARATGKPAVLISTSGTAVANYLPAVVEAATDQLPMLLITADRPPELRDTAANQTIYQPYIFGHYVRWFFDMPVPDAQISPRMVLTTINQAIYRAQRSPAGPVHLNFMFREPLEPVEQKVPPDYFEQSQALLQSKHPWTRYDLPQTTLSDEIVQALKTQLNRTRKGLVVVGQLSRPAEIQAALQLTDWLRWPVFADITSGLRLRSHPRILNHLELLLSSPKFQQFARPELVLHLGGRLTSKRFWQWMEAFPPEKYIMLKSHPLRFDPAHRVSWHLEADLPVVVPQLCTGEPIHADSSWQHLLSQANSAVAQTIARELTGTELNEPAVARILSQRIPEEHGLFLASSLPVREMDWFAASEKQSVAVAANRGASGIDGTLASASGFACGLQRPVTVLIGDLAFLHDMNSLHLLAENSTPVVVILINNHGGGIFQFLPIAQYTDVFERYFATPHPYQFAEIARQFDIPHHIVRTQRDFSRLLANIYRNPHTTILEVVSERKETHRIYQQIISQIGRIVEQTLNDRHTGD